MKLNTKTPRDFINPLLSKRDVNNVSDLTKFKEHLSVLLKVNRFESEEHQKNAVRDFLHKRNYYQSI